MAAAFAAEIAKQKGGGGAASALAGALGGAKKGGVDMKKYERMKKMGLPMNSIINKMRMDGCDSKAIESFGGKSAKKAKPSSDEKQIMPSDSKPSKKMKPFHWAKITQHQATTTIWKDAEKQVPQLCKQINFQQLDIMFNKEAEAKAKEKEKTAKKKRENQLIDPKRAQNVMIGLAQIKMSEDDLLDAILKMDDKVNVFCEFALYHMIIYIIWSILYYIEIRSG